MSIGFAAKAPTADAKLKKFLKDNDYKCRSSINMVINPEEAIAAEGDGQNDSRPAIHEAPAAAEAPADQQQVDISEVREQFKASEAGVYTRQERIESANRLLDEAESLANRADLSDRVSQVVGRLNSVEALITKIIKCPGYYYEVQTDRGAFYGKRITNALGICAHKVPKTTLSGAAKNKFQDMDAFKRALDVKVGLKSKYCGVTDVEVIGPNAANDVAAAMRMTQNDKVRCD